MSSYTLYAHKNSYAMSTHLMLEELGVEYQVVWFNVHDPDTFPAEFASLNPNGRVPTLVTPDGPVYESAATLMVLSEQNGGHYLPEPGNPTRARALQWLFYLMSTFQPAVLIQFHPERYFPQDTSMQDALKRASSRELDRLWGIIDDALSEGPHFLGETYSLCDMLFVTQAVWKENQPTNLLDYPNALRTMRTVLARDAVQRTLALHGVTHLAAVG